MSTPKNGECEPSTSITRGILVVWLRLVKTNKRTIARKMRGGSRLYHPTIITIMFTRNSQQGRATLLLRCYVSGRCHPFLKETLKLRSNPIKQRCWCSSNKRISCVRRSGGDLISPSRRIMFGLTTILSLVIMTIELAMTRAYRLAMTSTIASERATTASHMSTTTRDDY